MLPHNNVKRCCFFFQDRQAVSGCDSSVVHLQSVAHGSVWSAVEAPSGEHILSLCHVSFSMWGKATHWVLQSHNEAPLSQTKRDQTICAWWTLISLTVEISVSCQLCESFISCCMVHSTGEWGIHINISFCFAQAFVELAEYQIENVDLVCLFYVRPC